MGENIKIYWTVIVTGVCFVLLGFVFGYGWGIEAGLPKLFAVILGKTGTIAFFAICGFILIIYGIFQLQKGEQLRTFPIKYLLKYYGIRILAGLLFMGSFGLGFLTGAKYGLLVGLISFIVFATLGILLHLVADKLKKETG